LSACAPAGAGLRFECTLCGHCCTQRGEYGHVYLNDAELGALARFLGVTPFEFRRDYTFVDEYGWTQLYLGEACVFLDRATNRCGVYAARPIQCRTFPFWRNLVRDGEWTAEARAACEGVGRGPLHRVEDIEPHMREMEESHES